MNSTATLSLSSKSLDCFQLAKLFYNSGIRCDITPNITIGIDSIEKGCRIVSTVSSKDDIKKMWTLVKNSDTYKTDICCGHLNVEGIYSGCVLNFSFEDKCSQN